MEKEAGSNIDYLHTEFNNENSRECTLLIEFNNIGFSYSIFKNNTNTVLFSTVSNTFLDFFKADEKQLLTIFKQEKVFNFSFSKVIVLIESYFNTLVPVAFYDKTKKKEFLSFNTVLPTTDLVYLDDQIQSIDYFNIYATTLSFNKIIKNTFVNAVFVSTSSLMLNNAKKITNEGAFFQLHMTEETLECFYFKNGLLEFNNSFSFNNAEDVVYNVLNVFKQLSLNTENIVLHLSGAISKDDGIFELLYMYIRNIEFMKKPIKLNYDKRVENIAEHYFLSHYIGLL